MMTSGSNPRGGKSGGPSPRDLELIAAFVDGRLPENERRAFMERLDREEELYEVFVETVRYRDQEAGRVAEVVEHPASRRRWGRLAAVAALVAAAVTPLVLLDRSSERYAAELVADGLLGEALRDDWFIRWSPMRGEPAPGTDEFETALRLGVRQVDLEVALRLGRTADAKALLGQMDALLGQLMMAEVMQVVYDEVETTLDDPRLALERAEASGDQLRTFLGDAGDAYELGQWAEAGVLAALGGNTELLTSRSFRGALREFPRDEWSELTPRLETIAGLLATSGEPLDLPQLERAFTALIDGR